MGRSSLAAIGGLAAALYMGQGSRAKDLARKNAWNKRLGLPDEDKAPIDQAMDWAKTKFKEVTTPVTDAVPVPVAGSVPVVDAVATPVDPDGVFEASRQASEAKLDDAPAEIPNELTPEALNAGSEGAKFDAHDASASHYSKDEWKNAPSSDQVLEDKNPDWVGSGFDGQ